MFALIRSVRIIKDIYTVEDWFRLAPPARGDRHWVDGRSAKELAKAWCGKASDPAVPIELQELLSTHPDINGVVILEAIPEHKVRFDKIRGEPRNTDLVCIGKRANQRIAISIEAKADKPFGELIADVLRTPRPSRRPERVEKLCLALFGRQLAELPEIAELRYQLLHGVAAALAYAGQVNASRALFVVHEFVKQVTDTKRNERDLNNFLNLLVSGAFPIQRRLCGPVFVHGNEHIPKEIPLYLGKIRTEI
jgi:Domain of unknown function (DUF6946)